VNQTVSGSCASITTNIFVALRFSTAFYDQALLARPGKQWFLPGYALRAIILWLKCNLFIGVASLWSINRLRRRLLTT